MFLCQCHFLGQHIKAQVASGDDHTICCCYDAAEVEQGLPGLTLGQQLRYVRGMSGVWVRGVCEGYVRVYLRVYLRGCRGTGVRVCGGVQTSRRAVDVDVRWMCEL